MEPRRFILAHTKVTELYHKDCSAVAERQQLRTVVLNVNSIRSLDDLHTDQQIDVLLRRKLKKRTQGNVESSKELIAVHTTVIRWAVPAVRKGPGSQSSTRRMPHIRVHLSTT
jgi:hypothetical protein